MKNKIINILLVSTLITLSGCSNNKYEEDKSYDTDLYGNYYRKFESESDSYSIDELYVFKKDNTYSYTCKEVFDGEIIRDVDETGDILSIKEKSDNITEVTIGQTDDYNPKKILKYKNILGNFAEVDVPKGKTFELHLDGCWYDEDGQYHICKDGDVCNCKKECPRYVRKKNIIYFQSLEEHKDNYYIGLYIVDDGLFASEQVKEQK